MFSLIRSLKGKGQSGQSIIELTLITPLLLVALYIPVDFGLAFFMGNTIATIARDGARIGSGLTKTGGTSANPAFSISDADTLEAQIVNQLPSYLKSRRITITFYEGAGGCAESVEVKVEGSYNVFFYQVLRLFGATVNNSIPMSRATRMRYNYQPYTQNTPCTTMSVDHRPYNITDA